jgi:hypothetical protein
MADQGALDPSRFWADLLSREPARITEGFARISPEDRASVLDHLRRMATEPDWHPLQRESARAALSVVEPRRPLHESEDEA